MAKIDIPKVDGEIVVKKDNIPSNAQTKPTLREGTDISVKTEDKERFTKITEADAKKRKKSKLKQAIFGADIENVGEYMIFGVAIPAMVAMVEEMFTQGLHYMFHGEAKKKGAYTSYGDAFTRRAGGTGTYLRGDTPSSRMYRTGRSRRNYEDFDDILLPSEIEWERVLNKLAARANKHRYATVLDLYDLVGLTGNSTDDDWGWTERDILTTRISGTFADGRRMYRAELPEPVELD